MSLNISDFNFFFWKLLPPPLKKVTPSFPATPFKLRSCQAPPSFLKIWLEVQPPSPLPTPPTEREGVQVNNRNTRKRCELCSKLTIKTAEQCQWRYSGVFNFKHISHLFLLLPLLTLKMLAGNAFVTYFFIIKE